MHRDSVSPTSNTMNSMFIKSPSEMDGEIKHLFHPYVNVDNHTPIKNLFNQSEIIAAQGNCVNNIFENERLNFSKNQQSILCFK